MPVRPFEGVSSGATRTIALRRTCGPLLGSRGDRGRSPDLARRTWVPSARAAFRRPPGFHRSGRTNGSLRPPAPIAFASLQRSIAAPPHRPGTPKGPRDGRCFLPWASLPHDTFRNGGPVARGASGPTACRVRGLATSFATSTPVPARALRPPSVHGLSPSRCSPRADPAPSREPLPSCRSARRFASLLKVRADAFGFRALPGVELVRTTGPSRARTVASMPPWRSSLQSVLPLRPRERIGSRPLPPHALGGLTSRPACISRYCGSKGSVGPSRGYRLSWGLLTLRPSRHRVGTRGGLAHGFASDGRRCIRLAAGEKPSRRDPTELLRAPPGAAVLR